MNTGAPYIPPPAVLHWSKFVFISSHAGPYEAQQGWLCVFSSSERKRETDRVKERKGESTEVLLPPPTPTPTSFSTSLPPKTTAYELHWQAACLGHCLL